MLEKELKDHYFSARYMCLKYMVRMLANYVVSAETVRMLHQEFNWSQFFILIGQMPLEFFCTRTVFTDGEGIQASADLIESLGR
jgi:citrate lyase synthetase